MVKISALPPMTSPDGDDEAPIVDDSVGSTKKFTLTLLKEWLQSLSGWITTAMLNNGSVTPDKMGLNSQIAEITTSQTTTSTSYTDLATVGPSVTVNIGANGMALVCIFSIMTNSGAGINYAGVEVSGASSVSPTNVNACRNTGTSTIGASRTFLQTGLTPGSNTFTMKYNVNSGTGTFFNRSISVIPL